MVELVRARVQVEVDASHHAVAERHVVRRDVGVPGGHVHRGVGQAEQPPGHVEQPLPDPLEVEVPAHHLRIHIVLLAAYDLEVVGRVAGVEHLGLRPVLPDAGQELVPVAQRRRLGRLADLVDERADRVTGLDHLDLGVVRRPAVVPEDRGELAAQGEELGEDLVVGGPALVGERQVDRDAGVAVVGELEHRDHVGVVQGQLDQSVVADRMAVDPVLREPVELLGADLDRGVVVADVAFEGLADLGEPLVDGADAVADLGLAIDARAPEVAEREVADPLGLVIESGDPSLGVVDHQQVVDLAVEGQIGLEPGGLDLGVLGLVADGLVRVDLLEQAAGREGVAEREGDLVPAVEQLGGSPGAVSLESRHQVAGLVQLVGGAGGQPGRPGVGPGIGGGHGQRREIGHGGDATGERAVAASPVRRTPSRHLTTRRVSGACCADSTGN